MSSAEFERNPGAVNPGAASAEPSASNLREYLEAIAAIEARWRAESSTTESSVWFRGHQCGTWPLEPSLFRDPYRLDAPRWEAFFSSEFKGRAVAYLQGQQPATPLQWFYLMRHHGVPTRLLDWTESSLVALYFASCPTTAGDQDGCVWVLNESWLLAQAYPHAYGAILELILDGSSKEHVPAPVRPPYVTPRISAQRSCFTLHPANPGAFARAQSRDGGSAALQKISIPASAKGNVIKDLRRAGITESVLFPDLEGLARELATSELCDPRNHIWT